MDGMMAGMKAQMVMMVPQMVIMGWINFFFQGFVLSECLQRLNHISTRVSGTRVSHSSRNAVQTLEGPISMFSDIRIRPRPGSLREKKKAHVS
jgi:hypothetical protein